MAGHAPAPAGRAETMGGKAMNIEMVSVSGGKFHRPDNTSFGDGGNVFRDARLMRCGRSLVPSNVFETVASANGYTGGRLERHICQQCEKKVSHLWRVSEVLRRLARTMILGGVQYDAGHSCSIVRRVPGICIEILIDGRQFTVNPKDVMR